MKLAFLAAGAASLLIVSPSFAADTANSTDVTVNGSVATQCGIGNQSGGGVRSLPNTVDLGSLVTTDGQLNRHDRHWIQQRLVQRPEHRDDDSYGAQGSQPPGEL
jgi:type 1 fimbria pilin